jgi:hypothetical protein
MRRRKTERPSLKIRVSHEVGRLSGQYVADAFERLLPIVERRVRSPPEECGPEGEAASAKPIQIRRG